MPLTDDQILAMLVSDKGLAETGEAQPAPLTDGHGVPRWPDRTSLMSLVHVPAPSVPPQFRPRRNSVVGYDGHHAGGRGQIRDRPFNLPRTRLVAARKAAGMTQYDLAVATGLTITGYANIERGRSRFPRMVTMEAIAAALGAELKWLCDE